MIFSILNDRMNKQNVHKRNRCRFGILHIQNKTSIRYALSEKDYNFV
jgi:hypothetical protein